MKLSVVFWALLLFSTALHADPALVGTYTGSLIAPATRSRADMAFGITIDIKTAEDGKLTGSIANPSARNCPGESAAEGTYNGKQVRFAAVEARQVAGCGALVFRGVAEGGKLIGKIPYNGAPRDIMLTK